jgi:polyphosphate kinase
MSADLLRPPQNFAEQPFATASADRHLPAIAAPVDADAVARAKALAAGLKIRLRSARLPAQVVEVAFLLEESRNPECPLLERIRILGLLASRLDHYFAEQAPDLPESQSQAINAQLEPLQQQAFTELQDTLLPALAREYGILVGRPEALNGHQREFLRRFFRQQLYPMLTPLAVDPGHPFPFISSHSINLLVHLSSPDAGFGPLSYARIKVPSLVSRFVAVPAAAGQRLYLRSEDAVAGFLADLFPGMQIEHVFLFRVLRAAHSSRAGDELASQSRGLRLQQLSSPVVRLEVEESMPDGLVEWLASHLAVLPQLCYRSSGPLAMFQLVDLANLGHSWD